MNGFKIKIVFNIISCLLIYIYENIIFYYN